MSVNDALIGCVKVLGGSKHVGGLMWPDLGLESAQRRLLDCLNDDRNNHHLTPSQAVLILKLSREKGHHDAAEWLMTELGYAKPIPVTATDVIADLQRQFIEASNRLSAMGERIIVKQAESSKGSK